MPTKLKKQKTGIPFSKVLDGQLVEILVGFPTSDNGKAAQRLGAMLVVIGEPEIEVYEEVKDEDMSFRVLEEGEIIEVIDND